MANHISTDNHNLASTYSKLLDNRFKQKSFTERFCGHKYSWNGVNSINVWSVDNMELYEYNNTAEHNRFTNGAALKNIGDTMNTYALKHNLSFSGIIDEYNNADEMSILKAQAIMKDTWDFEVVPYQDKFRLKTWANGAGIVEAGAAADRKTIVESLLKSNAAMNNKAVPHGGRACFMSESLAVECQLADQLTYNQNYTSKSLVNGELTRLGGLPIVTLPDGYLPAGVDYMIKWAGSSVDPQKLKEMRVLNRVQGIYGDVMEGLVRFDSFVLANKCDGILIHGKTGYACTAPTCASAPVPSLSPVSVTFKNGTAGEQVMYTLDGSNPKVNDNPTKVKMMAADSPTPISVPAGATLTAYVVDPKGKKLSSSLFTFVNKVSNVPAI